MKIFLRALLISAFIILNISFLSAQQNPPGIDWKEIDTGTYRIVFPSEIEALGQYTANLMVHYEKYNYRSMRTRPRKIPIVLINGYSQANGFVSAAPFYSHWFTTPSSFDSIEWFKGLAVHEGRHMAQFNKLKDGPGKGAWRVLAGPMGTAAFQVLYVPLWFMEGDAVVMETALTRGGRGRLPSFDMWHRALEMSGTRYSYLRSYLGSRTDMYPYADYYRLGYILCSYVRNHYGLTVWDRVLAGTGKYFLFPTFDSALETETGWDMEEIYNNAMNEYREIWKSRAESAYILPEERRSPSSPGRWVSYLYPAMGSDGKLKAVRFSRDSRPSLVTLEKGKAETEYHVPYSVPGTAFHNERAISFGGGLALWSEQVPDPRWGYLTWSDLKLMDLDTGKARFITDRGRYLSSALSRDGREAAAVSLSRDMKYKIDIIDISDKKAVTSFPADGLGYIFDPAVSDDRSEVAFALLSDRGNALGLLDRKTGKITRLIDYTFKERIKSPVFSGRYIFYCSDYSGTDGIYALDRNTGKRYMVTTGPMGAFFPQVSSEGRKLYFNGYTHEGYHVSSVNIDSRTWVPISRVKHAPLNYIDPIAQQELAGKIDEAEKIPQKKYPVKDYSHLADTVNIWGWFPFFNSTDTNFSFSILSRNILHTTDISASYIRNFNEGTDAVSAQLIYSGLYPVLTAGGSFGERAVYLEEEDRTSEEIEYSSWKEKAAWTTLSLPLNFSRGVRSTFITAAAEAGYIEITDKDNENYSIYEDISSDGSLKYLKYSLALNSFIRGSLNGLGPAFGQVLNLSYTHTPAQCDYRGRMFSADAKLYFPGLSSNHSLFFTGSYEYIDYINYLFPSSFLFPRGYDSVRHEKFYKAGVDYAVPLLNVSIPLWKLVYIKRFNGTLFFDYGTGITGSKRTDYPSAGFEITAEQNLLSNMYLLIEAGVRYSRCFETDENRYDFVLKVPLY